MATKTTPTPDTEALVEHFKALPLADKKTVLDACQAALADEAEAERKDLLSRLAELDRMTGRPEPSAPKKAGDAEGRNRNPAGPVTHRGPDGQEWRQSPTGKGKRPQWLQELLDAGRSLDEFRV